MATGFALYQQALSEFSAIGPKRLSTEFQMDVLDQAGGVLPEWSNGKLKYLVKTAQIPSMQSTVIEHNIMYGMTGRDQGPPDIGHEMTVQLMESVDGRTLRFLQNWFVSQQRYDVQLTLVGPNDDTSGSSNAAGRVYTLKHCFANREAVDLDVSSNTEAVNVSMNLIYAYCQEFFSSDS